MIARGFAVGLLSLALCACEAGTFRTFDLDAGGTSHTMDASQRLLLVTSKGGPDGRQRVVCAEPSPDSLTSIAASAAIHGSNTVPITGGGTAKTDFGAGVAYGESAAYVGMRTQTVQLLRDGLYRACEAYMNGALDEAQYNILLVNMSQLMVALTAIDGLTGRPAAPPMVLSAPEATVSVDGEGKMTAKGAGGAVPSAQGSAQTFAIEKVNADAVAKIAKGVTGHSTFPAMCLSILASRTNTGAGAGYQDVRRLCQEIFRSMPSKIRYASPAT